MSVTEVRLCNTERLGVNSVSFINAIGIPPLKMVNSEDKSDCGIAFLVDKERSNSTTVKSACIVWLVQVQNINVLTNTFLVFY